MLLFKNRRILKRLILLSSLLLFAALLLLVIHLNKDEGEGDHIDTLLFTTVPTDASLIFYLSDFNSLLDYALKEHSLFYELFFDSTPLSNFVRDFSRSFGEEELTKICNCEALFSLHYSGKNQVSPLMALNLKDYNYNETRGRVINSKKRRNYSGVEIESMGGVEFAFFNGFLLASPSQIILEQSIRHLQAASSILDDEQFLATLSKTYKSNLVLFINHTQVGKLFSGYSARKYLKYADFTSNLCSWSKFYFTITDNSLVGEGDFTINKGAQNYLSLFKGLSQERSKVESVLPFNTFAHISFTVNDFTQLSSGYNSYREAHRKANSDVTESATTWISKMKIKELTFALIPYGGMLEGVTIIKKGREEWGANQLISKLKSDPLLPSEFVYQGVIAAFFGSIFNNTNEEAILENRDWVIIGPSLLIEEFSRGAFDTFSISDYTDQTKARNLINREKSLLTISMNSSFLPDSSVAFFNNHFAKRLKSVWDKNNVMLSSCQFSFDSNRELKARLILYADSLQKPPSKPKGEVGQPVGWELDTVIVVPKGPFALVNFKNGEREYLEQLPNRWLSLKDKEMKGIWSVPFNTPLAGYVMQIDFLENGKLQMLFASGRHLYLLDRSGRYVHPSPIKLRDSIVLGPKLYKRPGDSQESIMVLHSDNTLSLYDKYGKPSPLWSDISVEETIKEFPELIKIGGSNYLVLRTQLYTRIYSINGNPVSSALTGKRSLSYDTPIIEVGGSIVKIRTIDGKEIILNLETGKFSRSK